MNKRLLDFVPDNQPFGFDQLMVKLIEQKQAINAYPFAGYWLDIGRPEDFERANHDVEAGVFPC
jgi:NDP-sugar pyrophosphorylase family protein